MAKNIVICCDGTWNTPDQRDGGVLTPTNVVRLYNALADVDEARIEQHKYYHPGVGTDGTWWDKAVGGGTGRGLDRNIMSAYHELCRHYVAGDDIFLFGFSRGAYTVRSLVGFIGRCGLLNPAGMKPDQIWARIQELFYGCYRKGRKPAPGYDFHEHNGESVPVKFLGVWDTVGALGIPDDMALLNLIDNLNDYTFHDTNLSPLIKKARHAVAIDEKRACFQPTLWKAADHTDSKEVWFAGVHCDVGGGYRERGLADAALCWMIEEAKTSGLCFDQAFVDQIDPDPRGPLHDSCESIFALLPTQPRAVPLVSATGSKLHASVRDRFSKPPIDHGRYWPQRALAPGSSVELDIFAREPWNYTGMWLEKEVEYDFQASGEWLDSKVRCEPEGTRDGKFQLGEAAHLVGSALDYAEEWFQRLTGNHSADFRGTRRHEDYPWFCLVGAIANGAGPDGKRRSKPHECFLIGGGRKYRPEESGYFYAYANDAWGFYGNNRGHVHLKVSRP